MTKRERLQNQLIEKEIWLDEARKAQSCDCLCHKPNSDILHFIGCCVGSNRNIPMLEQEIASLRKKLRK